MKDVDNFLKGNIEDKEVDESIRKLITAKMDRDKKRRWSKILKEVHGIEKPEDIKKKENE